MEIVSITHVRDIANAYMEYPGYNAAINTINDSILKTAEQGGLYVSIPLKEFDGYFESYKEKLIKRLIRAGYNASISSSQTYIGANFEDKLSIFEDKLNISWYD